MVLSILFDQHLQQRFQTRYTVKTTAQAKRTIHKVLEVEMYGKQHEHLVTTMWIHKLLRLVKTLLMNSAK